MRVALVANVGARDVVDRDAPKGGRTWDEKSEDDKARAFGRRILADYDKWEHRLDAPILHKTVQKILETYGRIDQVLLFVTDQSKERVGKKNQDDTVYFGQVLERLLAARFPNQIGAVECCSISDGPNAYDKMLDLFQRELPERLPPDQFDEVWVAMSAGIPACTTAALVNGVRTYRLASRTVYVAEGQEPQTLDIQNRLLADFAREQARAYLGRYDFVALRELLKSGRLGAHWHRQLCTYADRRLHFDFEGARRALDEARSANPKGEVQKKIEQCTASLERLMTNVDAPTSRSSKQDWSNWFDAQRARLRELYFNLQVKARREEWFDVLARLYRLQEASLRYMFERESGHSAEKSNKTDFDRFFEKHRAQAPKAIYVGALIKGLKLNAAQTGKNYDKQLHRNVLINKLRDKRHKTIVAHGYDGVSRKILEDLLKPRTLDDFINVDLRELLADPLIGASVSANDDPFSDVISWLHEVC